MNILYVIIGLLVGTGLGIVIGRFLLLKLFKDQEVSAQNKVKKILKDAENNAEILKKNKLLEAKEKFLQMKAEHEQEVTTKNNNINQRENGVKQKEQSMNPQKPGKTNRDCCKKTRRG
jgi:ribonuclease Y